MITIDRIKLTNAVTAASAAVPARTSKDILKSILLVADGSQITLSASDGEIHLRTVLEYKGERETVLLPAARTLAILRELDGETVKLTIKPNKLRIQCGSADFDIGISDPSDYPELPMIDSDSYWQVDPMVFREAIRRTIYCVDLTSTRYALAGIEFQLGEQSTIAGTDSRRLSVQPFAATGVNNPQVLSGSSPVIPAAALKLVEKSLEVGTPVHISVRSNDASFRIGNVSITSQLLQGRFPDWRNVVPDENQFTNRILIPVLPFAQLLRQAGVMESEESKGVDLTFGKESLRAQSKAADIGQATCEIPIANEKEPMTVTLGGQYVREYLKCLPADASVEVCLISVDDRIVFKVGEYVHVVMPISKD